MQNIVNLLNEIGMLSLIPRSGFAFLGSGKQSVAEHSFRVTLIAYTLANLSLEYIDRYKLVMMCLFHDLPEARVGDLNYVQKRYLHPNLPKLLGEIEANSPMGPEIVNWIKEFEEGQSLEAKLAKDADYLELILVLKRQYELGNVQAEVWHKRVFEKLKTPIAKQLGEKIWETSSDNWWMDKPTVPVESIEENS